ncbi:MAG: hypothetical protein WEA31_06515 [Pirellulales bacterium]
MAEVVGYHACRRDFAEELAAGRLALEDWPHSTNAYDWLGSGIYFWEGSFRRAEEWGRDRVRGEIAIIEAKIQLGRCLDLMETEYLAMIRRIYERLVETYNNLGIPIPSNMEIRPTQGTVARIVSILDRINSRLYSALVGVRFERRGERKLRNLDCLVLNQFLQFTDRAMPHEKFAFQTVRCSFEEGDPIFPGSMIRQQNHIQISVRDSSCLSIMKVHRK